MKRSAFTLIFAMFATSAYAGTVTINSTSGTLLGSANSTSIDAGGNITIQGFNWSSGCIGSDCGSTTSNPSVPACSISAQTNPVASGSSTTLTANCSNSPTAWVWKKAGSATCTSASTCNTGSLTETTLFSLVASNATGPSSESSINVSVTTQQSTQPSDCSAYPPADPSRTLATQSMLSIWAQPNSNFYGSIAANKIQPYSFRNDSLQKANLNVQAANGTAIRLWVSSCPGVAQTSVPLACNSGSRAGGYKTVYVSSTDAARCLIPNDGKTYYVNVENASTTSMSEIQAVVYRE